LIRVWRIVHRNNINTAFSGEGSRKRGSRWTSPGHHVVYTSESLSLATLEILVHGVSHSSLKDFVCIWAKIPNKIIEKLAVNQLPGNWRDDPPPLPLQTIGNNWIDSGSSCVLQIPSAIIPIETNFMLNPKHSDFHKIEIGRAENWSMDGRLAMKP
jgi:RES domain-containing protein